MAPYIPAFKLSEGNISMEHPGAAKASDVDSSLLLRIGNTLKCARHLKEVRFAAVPDEELAKLIKHEHLAVSALAGSAPQDDLADRLTASLTAVLDAKFVDFKKDMQQYVDAKFVDFKQYVDDKFVDFKQYVDDKFAGQEVLITVHNSNTLARVYNSGVLQNATLMPVKKECRPSLPSRAALGAVPPPNISLATRQNLKVLTGAQIDQLEEFYEERFAGQDMVARREALGVFLGAIV
ncbi:hypothetical protein HYH03_001524 [Edaphochlamys debaryana]|uniref:Uncharacterized protein n=1 Tax=Edaphochlamys debaryana TaxID=47281 RepID=A0A835YD52_9CHLO|nr:hypothetical protein HYH03_001524 [Edaphochlamys debaryana]|eukprot:KAG2500762.1 hypothetical protein HYH03_001524 [Edaphochlamys debaryana]